MQTDGVHTNDNSIEQHTVSRVQTDGVYSNDNQIEQHNVSRVQTDVLHTNDTLQHVATYHRVAGCKSVICTCAVV